MRAKRAVAGPNASCSIGQVSLEVGISSRAIRYYEERGLLSVGRQRLGRVYNPADRARVAMIVRWRRLGISTSEIARLFPSASPTAVLQMLQRRLSTIEAERADLERARRAVWAEIGCLRKNAAPAETDF